MYLPTGCKSLKDVTEPQIRLGIQGFGGTGKTWAALTFPNCVVVNLDRGLGAHSGREDVIEVPLYRLDFCKSVNPNHQSVANLKDTILFWLDKEAKKLEQNQTLVYDGGTTTQNAYHKWYDSNTVYTKKGAEDEFAQWRLKLEFFSDLCERFKLLNCNVIYICHEFEKPDRQGDSTGKIRPLLSGQFCNQITSYFTDWVRQLAGDKPKDISTLDDKKLVLWNMDKKQFQEMCNTYPRNTLYYFQLESDDIFDGKISSLINFPRFIPANYESFRKYMRKK
jgi:hypothetical protein